MISLETQHFNINRILLLIIGLWPYQRSLLVEFQLILLYGILMTFIVFQIRTSLKQLQDVCNEITDKNEIAIIEKYGDKAKRITITILFLGMFYQVTFTLIYIWPYIHHIMAFTNKSRSHSSVHIMTEYFIDQEKHSYLVTLHRHAACCIGLLAMITTGTMLLTYAQHTCAMISIACYRIEHAMDILLKGYKNEQKSCEEIIHAVNIHRKAMNLINFLISNFSGSYFCLMAAGVLCLSCNLLRLTSFTGNIGQLILSLTNLIIQYVYLFLANYTAQEVTDHNEYLFTTVYNVRWYMAPIRTQKMILFLLQRGTKSFHLILGGVFVASLQSAASRALPYRTSPFFILPSKNKNMVKQFLIF
ncbi:uncharacterized protein [Polyergus mexicanus]|uniref:uncharacterized protein isoform X3 n=1 Tax=Polyergus mexicanus TaxID=615972 RepID=UPI0038B4AF9C